MNGMKVIVPCAGKLKCHKHVLGPARFATDLRLSNESHVVPLGTLGDSLVPEQPDQL